MPLTPYTGTSNLSLVISVENDGSPAQMEKDLNDALTLVREAADDKDLYFAAIDITGTWRPDGEMFYPWDEAYMAAWLKLAHAPEMRAPLTAWLSRVAALVKLQQDTKYESLWEHDEVQLGEVPAAALAIADKASVPLYVDLLKVWDLDHAVAQFDIIEQLVANHGDGPETAELAEIADAYL